MIPETIYWHDAKDVKPDEDLTILVETNFEVEQGFLNEGEWHWTSGALIEEKVISWADLPQGTKARKAATKKARAKA